MTPHDSTGLDHYRRLFGPLQHRRKLDHASLPSPIAYLTQQGLLPGKSRGEWASIRCPAHKSGAEAHPSLRVSLIDGHFRCHACGAKGGDIIALHRLATGLGFREAVRDLGGQFYD
jgi:CHC2 zinc finger